MIFGSIFLLFKKYKKENYDLNRNSKETFILVNNWFMMFYLITVLLGTIYPIFTDALTDNKISVGPPFYNAIIFPVVVIFLLFMAIGAVEWLTMARIVRSQVMNLSKQEFILAAEAMGVSKISIILRHLIPNTIGPVIVYATLTIPQIMLLEAFLSFLGLGVQAPLSSWGLLIRDGAVSMEEYWWLLIFPSLAFSLTLFSLNFIGDGLRDALDPRSSDG